MKQIYFVLFAVSVASIILGMSQVSSDGDKILGKWKMNKTGNIVEIYKQEEKYFGKIIELKASDNKAIKIGTIVLKNFIYNEEKKRWEKGVIYLPKRKKDVSGELKLEDANILEVTGSMGFASQSSEWTRVPQ